MMMASSKVEFLAQKNNRVAQHRLDDRIVQIEKEFTLSKLTNRIFTKQLRYDMAQVKKSTGHSPLARPPSGEADTRNIRRMERKLPKLGRSAEEPTISESRNPGYTSSANPQLRATFPAVSLLTTAENTSLSLVTGDDVTQSAIFLTQSLGGNESGEMTHHGSPAMSPSFEANEDEDEDSNGFFAEYKDHSAKKLEKKDILARIEEAKRIINMPSIYQTARMKSKQRIHNRVLPPIAVAAVAALSLVRAAAAADELQKESEKQQRSKPNRRSETPKPHIRQSSLTTTPDSLQQTLDSNEQLDHRLLDHRLLEETIVEESADQIRVSFTPEAPANSLNKEKQSKKPAISEILQASLAKEARQRREERRKQQRLKFKSKLAIETGEGLLRPENMKLIQKTFKKEDLYKEHKDLLAQNDNHKHIPVSKLLGANKLQGKLQAFLDKK